jgi:hypothetical protein
MIDIGDPGVYSHRVLNKKYVEVIYQDGVVAVYSA